jgi:hypothetical protein
LPARDAGIGSGIVNVSQQVSAALSVAVLGAVSSSRTATLLARGEPVLHALDSGYRLAFTIAMGSVVVGIVLGAVILKNPRPTDPESEGVDTGSDTGTDTGSGRESEAVSETLIAEVL